MICRAIEVEEVGATLQVHRRPRLRPVIFARLGHALRREHCGDVGAREEVNGMPVHRETRPFAKASAMHVLAKHSHQQYLHVPAARLDCTHTNAVVVILDVGIQDDLLRVRLLVRNHTPSLSGLTALWV